MLPIRPMWPSQPQSDLRRGIEGQQVGVPAQPTNDMRTVNEGQQVAVPPQSDIHELGFSSTPRAQFTYGRPGYQFVDFMRGLRGGN